MGRRCKRVEVDCEGSREMSGQKYCCLCNEHR